MRYTKFLKDTCRLLGTQSVSGFDTSKIHFTTSLDFVSISQWQSQGHRLPWDLTRFKSSETKEKTSEAQTQQIQLTVGKLLDQNQDHLDVSKDDECDRKKKWIAKLLNLSEAASLFTKRTKGNSNNCSGFIYFWDILCQFTIKDSSVLRHNFWKWERYHGYTEMIENSSTQIYFAVMQAIISRKVRLLFKCQISHFGMKPAWFANGW